MYTTLLIFHGVMAVFLLGAITHQALSLWWWPSSSNDSFFDNLRNVRAADYTNAVIVLFSITFCVGGWLYPPYRLEARPALEDLNLAAAVGAFEIKEHFAAIGLLVLPAYWYYWRNPSLGGSTLKLLTGLLAFIVWYNFLVGHILNNIRGLWGA